MRLVLCVIHNALSSGGLIQIQPMKWRLLLEEGTTLICKLKWWVYLYSPSCLAYFDQFHPRRLTAAPRPLLWPAEWWCWTTARWGSPTSPSRTRDCTRASPGTSLESPAATAACWSKVGTACLAVIHPTCLSVNRNHLKESNPDGLCCLC